MVYSSYNADYQNKFFITFHILWTIKYFKSVLLFEGWWILKRVMTLPFTIRQAKVCFSTKLLNYKSDKFRFNNINEIYKSLWSLSTLNRIHHRIWNIKNGKNVTYFTKMYLTKYLPMRTSTSLIPETWKFKICKVQHKYHQSYTFLFNVEKLILT